LVVAAIAMAIKLKTSVTSVDTVSKIAEALKNLTVI